METATQKRDQVAKSEAAPLQPKLVEIAWVSQKHERAGARPKARACGWPAPPVIEVHSCAPETGTRSSAVNAHETEAAHSTGGTEHLTPCPLAL